MHDPKSSFRRPTPFVVCLASLSLAACTITFGEPTPSSIASESKPPDATGAVSGAPDTGGGGAASSSGGGASPTAKATRSGHVSLTQSTTTIGVQTYVQWSAVAAFVDNPAGVGGAPSGGSSAGTTCEAHEDGACVAYTCNVAPAGDGQNGGRVAKQPHAGEVKLELAGQTVTLLPRPDGSYSVATGQTKLFGAAERVNIKAAGDVVPAFEQALVTPTVVTITAPAWPAAGQAVTLERGAPLDVAWTGGDAGQVYVSAGTLNAANDRSSSVACRFDGKAGRGTIPAAITDKLIASPQGALSAFGHTSIMLRRGEFDLYLSANASARTASGATASGLLRVE